MKFSYKKYFEELEEAKKRGATQAELDELHRKWSGTKTGQSVAMPDVPAKPEPVPMKTKPPRKERRGDRF